MTLEAQLLQIIEEQQKMLKEQQRAQQASLELLQVQSRTIEQLKTLTHTLGDRHSEAKRTIEQYQQTVQKLSEQTISPTFTKNVQETLERQLETHLAELVQTLEIENSVEAMIQRSLPKMIQREIDERIKPLARQLSEKMTSVEQYQQKLADLIQKISSRL